MVPHVSRGFDVRTSKGAFFFPYVKARPSPTRENRVAEVAVDPEIGNEGFTYHLRSGEEGTVHVEQVLDYNRDADYMRDVLLYRLTLEAGRRIAASPLSKREIIRRLGTSPAQLYRLLDTTNYRKTVDRMLALLHVLGCDVDLRVRPTRPRHPGRAA